MSTASNLIDSGWIDRSDRVRIRVDGPDRAKFLHNLVTNDVKKLTPGQGCEAFVTTPQGKTLAYVQLTASETSILLRSDVGQIGTFLPHLLKYGIFDAVELVDESAEVFEIHAWGDLAHRISESALVGPLPGPALSHRMAHWAGTTVTLIREDPTRRPGLTLVGSIADRDVILTAVADLAGGESADPAWFEAARIGAGTPVSGRDVSPSNLPQEVGRDRATISFVKGCYLGQETVARLDALGHVNKILRGLRIEGETVPPDGASITADDGKSAGTVTSATRDPVSGQVVGLGYVRVAHAGADTQLRVEVAGGSAPAWVVVFG